MTTSAIDSTVTISDPYTGELRVVALEDALGFDELPDIDLASNLEAAAERLALMAAEIVERLKTGRMSDAVRREMVAETKNVGSTLAALGLTL